MTDPMRPFHLALPVTDLAAAENFYCELLGCRKGRAASRWVVLNMPDWRALAERLEQADCDFLIAPKIRFEGEVGEQATLFLCAPSGNALEFKGFKDAAQLIATCP